MPHAAGMCCRIFRSSFPESFVTRETIRLPLPEQNHLPSPFRKRPRKKKALRNQLSDLPEDQLAIISAIDPTGTHVDDIILRSGLPTASVLRHLTILTIKNYVKRNPGNFYQLNITKK